MPVAHGVVQRFDSATPAENYAGPSALTIGLVPRTQGVTLGWDKTGPSALCWHTPSFHY